MLKEAIENIQTKLQCALNPRDKRAKSQDYEFFVGLLQATSATSENFKSKQNTAVFCFRISPRKTASKEQFISAIKRQEDAEKKENIGTELGIHQATFYKWKSKLGGMGVLEARKLRALEDDNSKLKKLVTELSLDKMALQSVLEKKW